MLDDDGNDDVGDFFGFLLGSLLQGCSSVNSGLEFTAYPYENDHAGYLADLANMDAATHTPSSRLWVEYGSDFDDIDLVSGGLLVEGASRFGFDLTWRTYFEDLGPEGHDHLSTGDANLLYRLLQSDRGSARIGAGMPWFEFGGDVDIGYNFTVSADLFPLRPWIISLEGDAGQVGHAKLLHARSTIGLNLRHAELYTGVDHLTIEDTDLTNMVFGLRTWW